MENYQLAGSQVVLRQAWMLDVGGGSSDVKQSLRWLVGWPRAQALV